MSWLILIGIILVGFAWAVAREARTCVGQLNRVVLALEELKENREGVSQEEHSVGSPSQIEGIAELCATCERMDETLQRMYPMLEKIAEKVSDIHRGISTLRDEVDSMETSLRDAEQHLGTIADNTERVAHNTEPPSGEIE